MDETPGTEQSTLLEDLEKRYQEAMHSGARWKLSVDEFLAAYAMGRRNFYFCSLANLSRADLSRANLSRADLSRADLSDADLRSANLSRANLSLANLSLANLSRADLSDADLRSANLSLANLSRANLSRANLSRADLSDADLSDAKGLLNPVEYLEKHFEWTPEGMIAYKTFSSQYAPNPNWVIEVGSVIEEVVNPCPGTDCGSGINVATLKWVMEHANGTILPVWKVLIRNAWLPGVIVPFHTDGKIRAARVELVGVVGNEPERTHDDASESSVDTEGELQQGEGAPY